ncbi:cellulosome enzyme [Fusarium circinatum]|uniref:Cellulosome enzyme n=1 Tax=Fusarium circinatum TaxID=48490 RepID=A0A8H5X9Y6_FUSCI|nr:cellulosome enzyme [Fusarium circinatum]
MKAFVNVVSLIGFLGSVSGQLTVKVDVGVTHQHIDGFDISQAFGRAKDTENGAGFSIIRNKIGSGSAGSGNIEPNNPGSPSSPPKYVWDNDDAGQVWFTNQAVKYGVKTIFADAWGAPGFMKTSGDDSKPGQMQISSNAAEAIDFIPILHKAIQSAGLDVQIVCCDATGWKVQSSYTDALAKAGSTQNLGVITSHSYSSDAKTPLSITSLPKWNTEAGDGSEPFITTWYKSGAKNEGFSWAQRIAVAMVNAELSAYLYWEGFEVKQSQSASHLLDALDGVKVTPSGIYYAFAMWSRYIRPGAVRVAASGSISNIIVGAFRNPDKSLVVVITNSGSTGQTSKITFQGYQPVSAKAYVTSNSMSFAPTDAKLDSNTVSVSAPSKGVVTVKLV